MRSSVVLASILAGFTWGASYGQTLPAVPDKTLPAAQPPRRELNVAVFAYLPDASSAIKQLEEAFEKLHPDINLDLELWNPYDDSVEDDGLEQISKFDIIEIDMCRFDELKAGKFGGLDLIPETARVSPDEYVEPARTVARGEHGKYFVAHWVCGNFITFWSTNKEFASATTFEDYVKALNPEEKRPFEADLFGGTTLGEIYADAVLDRMGAAKAAEHFKDIARRGEAADLFPDVVAAVMSLTKELRPTARSNAKYFHNLNQIYPQQFANEPGAALFGYSERLYYAERELQFLPDHNPPSIKDGTVTVRPFPFAGKSIGTPTWIDAFVIPKGRLQRKLPDILLFLQFVRTEPGYRPFAMPAPYGPGAYLLPATAALYDGELSKSQPMLKAYRDQLDSSFPVVDNLVYRGLKAAGKRIEKQLGSK